MGQYWYVVNIDKKEYVHPHKLGTGLKLWEQLANHPGTGAALLVLCAAMPKARGGGDFDLSENWHDPERKFPEHGITPGPMPEEYPEVAKRTIGRWAGDRIALIGDYAEAEDLPKSETPANAIYGLCQDAESWKEHLDWLKKQKPEEYENQKYFQPWKDVSMDVARVIEHELGGKYEGDGWRHFKREGEPAEA